MKIPEIKNTSLDAKREEFRKYLEKEDVLEYLTKHLVPLYEKADKPTSALEYLKNNFAGKEVEEAKQKPETLESENRDLKKNVERLETEKNTLTSEVADLKKELEARKNVTDKVTDKNTTKSENKSSHVDSTKTYDQKDKRVTPYENTNSSSAPTNPKIRNQSSNQIFLA